MSLISDPLSAGFFTNALIGGVLATWICAIAGTWVVVRGMAFLGEAIAHGMLPGVALASLAGWSPLLGAGLSALVMAAGIGWLGRRTRISQDTSIGIAFVIMLSLGVIIVSRSKSFATDLTAILFGDVLAMTSGEIRVLAVALALTVALAAVLARPLQALALDEALARTLGMRPRLASFALTLMVTLAVVASYRAVGSLLVVALLVAPPATASLWSRSIVETTIWAGIIGSASVVLGMYLSWYAATAAGASIATVAGAIFLICAPTVPAVRAMRHSHSPTPTPSAPIGA
ncbi:zinc ABC transporter permease AztB [Actinomyces sp. B33]|uniref:zinc ABC transporter permease AztB n=1 Tax=Actinomyces sp. B33 TaxID=2942131 RepID=UPI0023427E50|nr:zinc ABC transporter permease AztB [Actinomyces sp. B33]MDC4233561.1 zinc ABC transporter permease AztB [Actinomyces sp. B33]